MRRCLQLAAMGAGNVAPNPMVGALLVYQNRIIGEGYHQQYGAAHAEVNCISSVKENDRVFIEQSTLYVSLEPCAHFGKTPPCVDLIIKNKIQNVVIGCRDSFKEVNGSGIEKLKLAGVQLISTMLENECREMNRRFFTFHEKQRPYIILKWAESKDGFMSSGNSARLLISNELTNRLVHQWRSKEPAILVGTNTAQQDNPELTTRLYPGKNPVRLVIDNELRLPTGLKLFDGSSKTIVFNYNRHSDDGNLIYYKVNKEEESITQILAAVYAMQIQSVIVEGGSKLLQSFIDYGLWDEARVITNTEMEIGTGQQAPQLNDGMEIKKQMLKQDCIIYFRKEAGESNQ